MSQKKKGIVLMSIGAAILIACSAFYFTYSPKNAPEQQTMPVDIYIQDKEITATSDCGATKKISIDIPEGSDIADESLKALFKEDLASYGEYDHIEITGSTAKVFLKNNTLPSGAPFSALSSCQVDHLQSVISDTLTQYGEIEFVEIEHLQP